MADDVRRLAPDFANIVDRMVDRLRNGGAGATAPGIGETVPPFVLPDDNGHLVSLESLLEKGTLVIAFHRGHWCPYCRIGAGALAQIEPALRERGASLVIITPETQRFNRALKADSGATCPFLSDLDCGYALELNLAIKINDEKRSAMTSAGWDIAKYQNNENWILPIPATYIVGRDGVILGRFVDPDYRRRMEVDDLLRAVDTPTRGVSSQG